MKLTDVFLGSGWRIAFWVVVAATCLLGMSLVCTLALIDDPEIVSAMSFVLFTLLTPALVVIVPALFVLGILAFVVFRKQAKEEVNQEEEDREEGFGDESGWKKMLAEDLTERQQVRRKGNKTEGVTKIPYVVRSS